MEAGSFDGEMLVKGRTLGLWKPKRFMINYGERMFSFKRKDPKKKYKSYFLKDYEISTIVMRKGRLQFELESQTGKKNILMGSEDHRYAQKIYDMLKPLCGKQYQSIKFQQAQIQQNIQDKQYEAYQEQKKQVVETNVAIIAQQQEPQPVQEQNQQQQVQQQEDDEFYDCEDAIDAINEKLHLSQEEMQGAQFIEELTQRSNSVHHFDSEDYIQWTNNKIELFKSGKYLALPLSIKHQQQPLESNNAGRIYIQTLEGGNYVLKQDFMREEKNGGLKCINEAKLAVQKSVLKFLLTRIGASLMMGKPMTGISMPVSIFEARSNTERVCNSMGFAYLLEEAAKSQDPLLRVKICQQFAFGFVFTYLSMEKPFNPILGETFQGSYDGCPIYCEQISHHPPICVTQFFGRGFTIDSRLELVANFHTNSVVGRNVGTVKVQFQNPKQEVQIILAPGCLNGTTYGDRILYYLDRQLCIDIDNQLISECTFNPDKKYCSFFNVEYQSQLDYTVGGIMKVNQQAIEKYQKDTYKKYKGLDLKKDVVKILHVIKGNWTKELKIDVDAKFISFHSDFPIKMQHSPYPLPSDSNYRLDVLEWKLQKFDAAQAEKEKLEILQRNDRKLREQFNKKK